jgi:hypothetical protein
MTPIQFSVSGGCIGPPAGSRRSTASGSFAAPVAVAVIIAINIGFGSPGVFGAGPGSIGWSPDAGSTVAGYVDSQGKLNIFKGSSGTWKKNPLNYPHQFFPGSPIAFLPRDSATFPAVVTVVGAGEPTGRLKIFLDGGFPGDLCPELTFPAVTHLDVIRHSGDEVAAAVDVQGNLWEINLTTSKRQMISPPVPGPSGMFPPGAPVTLASNGPVLHVFAVDREGSLTEFIRKGVAWHKLPNHMDYGYLPGSSVSACQGSVGLPGEIRLAVVDGTGILRHWSFVGGLWSAYEITSGLQPGSSIEIGQTPFGPMISSITPSGEWRVWIQAVPPVWTETMIGPGFLPDAPIAFASTAGTFFTLDAPGRLICASWSGTQWNVDYALPEVYWTPQLISRRIVPNDLLPPAEVALVNAGSDPILIQVVDEFRPRAPQEIRIPPGQQVTTMLERDAGAVLEEVYLAPGPAGTLIERTETLPLPPRPRYSLVAWSDKVTYQYIDRRKNKPKGAPADFDRRSQVSLTVISVPPGDLLEEGDQFDILRLAKELKNPGAVRWFPKPQSTP